MPSPELRDRSTVWTYYLKKSYTGKWKSRQSDTNTSFKKFLACVSQIYDVKLKNEPD